MSAVLIAFRQKVIITPSNKDMSLFRTFTTSLVKAFTLIGKGVRFLINSIFAFLTYILGLGPVSLVAKISGKKFLNLSFDKSATTYWEKAPEILDKKEFYRQF